MVQPQIDGMELLGLVGEGSCGSVFIARDVEGSPPTLPDTKWYAVRVFNALAVNRPLIERMVERLFGGDYPKGVVPITWKESKQGSRCMVMPILADVDEEKATILPRSLQEKLGDYPAGDAWQVIGQLARALAEMHHHRIPHGNLKPGNIFFDDNGGLLLTDFAMGHMPGVGMPPYTDALLYAPPEQLREPEGYLSDKGFTWDVHAFAVIAFRLLTGKFPGCEATLSKVVPASGRSHIIGIQADVIRLAERLEYLDLDDWIDEAEGDRERKRREVIQKCLSLNPEDRYGDLDEVIQAWEAIDADSREADEKAGLLMSVKLGKLKTAGLLGLAAAGTVGCVILAGLLATEKSGRSSDNKEFNSAVAALEQERDSAKASEAVAIKAKNAAEKREQDITRGNTVREARLREQLSALGIANDRLLEWMMRTESTVLPELKKSDPGCSIMERELRQFLKLTNGDNQFQPIRARVMMQLAELAIHGNKPAKADKLLDRAAAAWQKARITGPGYHSRLARARLACLLVSQDQNDSQLTATLLPKARQQIQAITAGDPNETRRINAVMHVIDGTMLQSQNPAKALGHFQLALKDLEGVHKALPEHVAVRSDLARFALHSATLAESLDLVNDADKLRGKAAVHLRWLLKKNPKLRLAKVKLAEIEIMAAESDMRAGNDSKGATELAAAEKLLAGLPTTDTSPDGTSMQTAIARGLRSVLLRDRGRTTDAAKSLDEAIRLTKRIVEANPDAAEPLYRLAIFHWQRGGISGDAGDTTDELRQGNMAASLMQRLLKSGAGKRDTELRRSLAYLYGDLGHTAHSKGKKSDAIAAFKNASAMWQSLITRNGKKEEYTEGLKWSKQRYREVGGR